MKLHAYKTSLFEQEGVQTEATAYHILSENPLAADVNYLAAPWSVLIRNKTFDQVNLQLDGGFTICQHCYFRDIIPTCMRIGLDTLFASHVETTWNGVPSLGLTLAGCVPFLRRAYRDRRRRLREFRVLPFPHLAINGAEPTQKDLWYSYIGMTTHRVRKSILQLPERKDTIIKERTRWHFDFPQEQQRTQKREYQQVLARSRFSLCPRGFGPGTIRFWESLQAGAIPVLIADTMSLPGNYDWDSAIVRVPETRVHKIESILQDISAQEEDLLRQNCLLAGKQFLGNNLISWVRHTYDTHPRAA